MANDLIVAHRDDPDDRLESLAAKIREEFKQLGLAFHKSADHARRIGDFFIAAKAECKKRGENFEPWVHAEFDISERTAQAYMRITNKWDELEKAQGLALFRIETALKLLANPKPPKPLLTEEPPDAEQQHDQNVIDAEFELHGDLPAPTDEKGERHAAEQEAEGDKADDHAAPAHDKAALGDAKATIKAASVVNVVPALDDQRPACELIQALQQFIAVDRAFDANPDPADEDYDRHEAARQMALEAIEAEAEEQQQRKLHEAKYISAKAVTVLTTLPKDAAMLGTKCKRKLRVAAKQLQGVIEEIENYISHNSR